VKEVWGGVLGCEGGTGFVKTSLGGGKEGAIQRKIEMGAIMKKRRPQYVGKGSLPTFRARIGKRDEHMYHGEGDRSSEKLIRREKGSLEEGRLNIT